MPFYILGTRVFVARVGRQTKTREYKDLEAHFTAHTFSNSAILYLCQYLNHNIFEKISCYFFFLISGTRVFVARVGRQTKTREYKDLEAHFTAHLGAKYLVFVSSLSLKTRELSSAQFVYFLRKVCLFFNF